MTAIATATSFFIYSNLLTLVTTYQHKLQVRIANIEKLISSPTVFIPYLVRLTCDRFVPTFPAEERRMRLQGCIVQVSHRCVVTSPHSNPCSERHGAGGFVVPLFRGAGVQSVRLPPPRRCRQQASKSETEMTPRN